MTHYPDHEKRIREALEKASGFSDNDLRALLADLDAMRGALNLCRPHMYDHASNTPDGAFDALCAALKGASHD